MQTNTSQIYNVGDFCFKVNYYGIKDEIIKQPQLMEFLVENGDTEFELTIQSIEAIENTAKELGNYHIPERTMATCHLLGDKKYGILCKSLKTDNPEMSMYLEHSKCDYKADVVLQGRDRFRQIRSAMFCALAFQANNNNSAFIHASCIEYDGNAYLFIGRSGRGKSTHSRMWLEAFPNATLLNDDKPLVRKIDDKIIAYGTPWSGKTKCFRNESFPLKGIVMINRGEHNHIERVSVLRAMSIIHPAIIGELKFDAQVYSNVITFIKEVVKTVPVYDLWCTPTTEAARVCMKEITK